MPAKRRRKLEPRWLNGVFLGRAWNSNQHVVGLSDGTVVRARAMVRIVPSLRWDAQRLLSVSGTPTDLSIATVDSIEETDDPHKGPPGHRDDGPEDELDQLANRVPILMSDLRKHGFTPGCRRCTHLQAGETIRARSFNHTEECRRRLDQLMREADKPLSPGTGL